MTHYQYYKKRGTEQLHITLSADLKTQTQEAAEKVGMTASALVRVILVDYLTRGRAYGPPPQGPNGPACGRALAPVHR